MKQRKTFSLQTLLLLTSAIASLFGLFYQGRLLKEQAREIANFREYVGYERPNSPMAPDSFDYSWELLANTADLKIYSFAVNSGDPHELLFNINGTETVVDSYYDTDKRTNTSRAAVCIDWISNNKIKISLGDTQKLGRFDFANRNSHHVYHTITDEFVYDKIADPEFNAMGMGVNGTYSWYDEPHPLFHWNGDETASLRVRFKSRTPNVGEEDKSDESLDSKSQ